MARQPEGCAVSLPRSATHPLVAWSGVGALIASVTVINRWPPFQDIAYLALTVMACTALGVFVPDLLWQRIYRRALASRPRVRDWERVFTKLLGLVASVAFVAALYWAFPEYAHDGGHFYAHYWTALRILLPLWAMLALPYLYWVDRYSAEPQDALWQLGRVLLLRRQGVVLGAIGQHLLGWLVKGFFLPLMFTYFCSDLQRLLHYDPSTLHSFKGIYDGAYFFLYFLDVALVSMTYLMSLRLTDTHIRSTEPTLLGWSCALICYQPFWSLIGRQYFAYDTAPPWGARFAAFPWLYDFWGGSILLCVVIYVWATIAFGARFSNLTHRGIITAGPYRYTKHPAYLAKNLSWWLISVPFLFDGSALETARRCVLLLALNGVYYLRAKTEERHLSLDPVYLRYAQWVDAHGALRFLRRVPLLGELAAWRPQLRYYRPPQPFDTPDERRPHGWQYVPEHGRGRR